MLTLWICSTNCDDSAGVSKLDKVITTSSWNSGYKLFCWGMLQKTKPQTNLWVWLNDWPQRIPRELVSVLELGKRQFPCSKEITLKLMKKPCRNVGRILWSVHQYVCNQLFLESVCYNFFFEILHSNRDLEIFQKNLCLP